MNEKNFPCFLWWPNLNAIQSGNILIPLSYIFQKLYPFSKVNTQNENIAAAAGGFILCKWNYLKIKSLWIN